MERVYDDIEGRKRWNGFAMILKEGEEGGILRWY